MCLVSYGVGWRMRWVKILKNWWRCVRELPGTILETARQRLTVCKPVCSTILISRFDMNENQFLRLLGQLPARLTAEQVAWVINRQPHDVPVLVSVRLFRPLGNPPRIGLGWRSSRTH
jgi:hypothetical protein